MGRQPRLFTETGLYHIVFRGVNHCHLFEENDDYEKFMEILKEVKQEFGFEIFAYCLMSNHVHLFICEKNIGEIVKIMKKVLTHYAGWFNRKYGRSGTLIANRYKSECVAKDEYLFALVRYIHQNPLKEGIGTKLDDYQWSSYKDYTTYVSNFVDCYFVLSILSNNEKQAIKKFIDLHNSLEKEEFIPVDKKRKTEAQIRREIIKHLDLEPNEIIKFSKEERDIALRALKEKGLSIRQIERATGISRGVVAKS